MKNNENRSQLGTGHDSWAVVTWVKLWLGWTSKRSCLQKAIDKKSISFLWDQWWTSYSTADSPIQAFIIASISSSRASRDFGNMLFQRNLNPNKKFSRLLFPCSLATVDLSHFKKSYSTRSGVTRVNKSCLSTDTEDKDKTNAVVMDRLFKSCMAMGRSPIRLIHPVAICCYWYSNCASEQQ